MSGNKAANMTDREILDELQSQSLLARVRAVLASSARQIDQTFAQRHMPRAIDIKRMEFEAAEKIIAIVKADSEAFSGSVMYSCGYEVGEGEFGMFAGPTPSLRSILTEVVDGDDGNPVPAFVLKLTDDGKTEKIAQWNYETAAWDDISTQDGQDGQDGEDRDVIEDDDHEQ